LHDVGRLVLASSCGTEYRAALDCARAGRITVAEAEFQKFGCTHAEVGAYLLGLWGLPGSVVQAVAWHHAPARSADIAFGPVIAVHVAAQYDHRLHPDADNQIPNLDENLLGKLGLLNRTAIWWKICHELNTRGTHND